MEQEYRGVIWTNHAIGRLYERRIPQSDAWLTLRRPEKTLRGKTPGSWKFVRTYGQQRIEVVAKQNEKREWVVLSCWSARPGDGRAIFEQQNSWETRFFLKLWKMVKKKFQQKRRKNG